MKKDWEIKKLGDVCETGSGGTPLKGHKEYYENGTIPWLRSGEVCKKDICESELFITETGLKKSSAKVFPINTVLVAMYGATAGQTGILRFQSTTNQAVCGILPNSKLVPEFIYYFFLSYKDKLIAQAVGGAQPNISQVKICNSPIPVPPLEEQKRIVKILDEKFAQLETIKTNAQTNLQNAKDLFQSQLTNAFSNTTWEKKKFSELFKLSSGDYLNSKSIIKGEYPIYGGNGIIDYHKEYNLTGDNIIIGRVGALCGNVRYISEPIWLTDNAFKLSFIDFNYDYSFITYLLNHINLRNFARQAAQPVISNSSLKDIEIPLPPLPEQKRIVKELDTLSEKVRQLQEIYTKQIANCAELKQSLLQKAFKGEL